MPGLHPSHGHAHFTRRSRYCSRSRRAAVPNLDLNVRLEPDWRENRAVLAALDREVDLGVEQGRAARGKVQIPLGRPGSLR